MLFSFCVITPGVKIAFKSSLQKYRQLCHLLCNARVSICTQKKMTLIMFLTRFESELLIQSVREFSRYSVDLLFVCTVFDA